MSDVYAVVEALAGLFPLSTLCEVLEVSRSAYYAWQSDPAPPGGGDGVAARVVEVFLEHRRRYGARRIAAELAGRGIACGVKRVAEILRRQGLRAIQPKSFVPRTTDSGHRLGYSPNLILDAAEPVRPHQVWVGDITYLRRRGGGFYYLAGLMDRFSRDIAGWEVAETITEGLSLAALRKAIRATRPGPGLIHHTDRGGQYAGHAYRAVLRRAGMVQSMSRAGECLDNAFMESCWGTFKREMEIAEYDGLGNAEKALVEYVNYYRFTRRHSALGYRTPHQFSKDSDAKK